MTNLIIRFSLKQLKAAVRVLRFQAEQLSIFKQYAKNTGNLLLHTSSFAVVLCILLLLSSCQKEKLSDEVMLNSTTSATGQATAKKEIGGFVYAADKRLNYGAFICPPTTGQGWLGFQQTVAEQLGISCLRGSTLVPGNGNSPSLLTAGYKVLFNFNTNNDEEDDSNSPTPFVSDYTQYKADLNNILALCILKPELAVIENEESNRYYYSGSAWDYIRELNAAINVMHASGIKVANGGLTSGGLSYLVYQNFMAQGKTDSAEQFRNITHVTPNSPFTQDRGIFVDSLLQAYNQMDVDYVNFHWKCASPDEAEGLKEVIHYLQSRCNKPVISNELGQYDKDENTLLQMIQVCTDAKLPYMVWYSPDENHGRRATPLQYDNATLTNTGVAYQGFLQ